MTDIDKLRGELSDAEFETDFGVHEVSSNEVSEGRIFGLAAGERMILSVILFLAVTIICVAILLATQTIIIPS